MDEATGSTYQAAEAARASVKQAAKRKEVKFEELTSEGIEEFPQAKQLERKNTLAVNAIKTAPPGEADVVRRELPDRLMPSRHCRARRRRRTAAARRGADGMTEGTRTRVVWS